MNSILHDFYCYLTETIPDRFYSSPVHESLHRQILEQERRLRDNMDAKTRVYFTAYQQADEDYNNAEQERLFLYALGIGIALGRVAEQSAQD